MGVTHRGHVRKQRTSVVPPNGPMNEVSDQSHAIVREAAEYIEDEDSGTEREFIEEPYEAGTEIKEPFDPTAINIYTQNPTIDLIIKRIDQQEIDLNPDFQRNSGIWDRTRQSRLIESLLLRVPIPVFYMAADKEDRWRVVDGLQRLDTLKKFILDKELTLHGLEYLKDFEKYSYDWLPRPMQRRIDETQLSCHIIQPGTPPTVMFNVFKRINTGGMPLLPQEIRHALNPGDSREFINALARDQTFLEATDHSVSPKRMADRECVLRFVAFYRNLKEYDGNLDDFLVMAMKSLNDMSNGQRMLLREDFRNAMRLAIELFGSDAFRRPSTDARRKPINKPLFESLSVNLAYIKAPRIRDRLVERKEQVKNDFAMLMKNKDFEQSISIGTQWGTRVRIRFGRIEELLRKVVE